MPFSTIFQLYFISLVEEIVSTQIKPRTTAIYWPPLSHNAALNTPRHERDSITQLHLWLVLIAATIRSRSRWPVYCCTVSFQSMKYMHKYWLLYEWHTYPGCIWNDKILWHSRYNYKIKYQNRIKRRNR